MARPLPDALLFDGLGVGIGGAKLWALDGCVNPPSLTLSESSVSLYSERRRSVDTECQSKPGFKDEREQHPDTFHCEKSSRRCGTQPPRRGKGDCEDEYGTSVDTELSGRQVA
jgi:hypothetical protein